MRLGWLGLAFALLLAQPVIAMQTADQAELQTVSDAEDLIRKKMPAEAIAMLDPLIATLDQRHKDDSKLQFCASSGTETIYYAALGATAGKDTVVYHSAWCTAIFLKGFALIDLERRGEARPYLERAVELAPQNAHFIAELAEFHKVERDWPQSYALFERAAAAAELGPEEIRSQRVRRAWRGMGFTKIEMGQLDEAEALMRKCLALDPNDAGAKQELDYIAEQRAKARPKT